MEFKETEIKGVYVIEPRVFNDARGYFFEAWKREEFKQHIVKSWFDNNIIYPMSKRLALCHHYRTVNGQTNSDSACAVSHNR